MDELCVNDDFFSPIRFDSSVLESDEDSDHVFEDNITKSRGRSELQLNFSNQNVISGKSIDICTPVSEKRASEPINAKKVDKTKHRNIKKEIASKNIVNILDYNSPELKSEQKDFRKKKPLSLISTPTDSMKHNMKNIKIEDKSSTHSLKNMCVKSKHISSRKYPSGKKVIDNSSAFMNTNVLKHKDAMERSIVSEEKTTIHLHHPTKEELNVLTRDVKKVESIANPFEASVEKMVHDCISFECDKIHRNVYMQQMDFHRQINKIKAEAEKQHSAMNERLFKVIEELMRINAILKST